MCVRRMVGFGCGAAVALLAFTTAVNVGADRRTPEVLQPTESAVAVIRLRLPGRVYDRDGLHLLMLRGRRGQGGH